MTRREAESRLRAILRDYVPSVAYYGPEGAVAALEELLDELARFDRAIKQLDPTTGPHVPADVWDDFIAPEDREEGEPRCTF